MTKWNYRRQIATKIAWGINKSKQCLPTNQPQALKWRLREGSEHFSTWASFSSTMFPTTSIKPFTREQERKLLPPFPSKWVTVVSLHSAFSKEVAKFDCGSLHILNAGSGYGQTRSEDTLLSKDGGALGKDRGWIHATSGRWLAFCASSLFMGARALSVFSSNVPN